MLFICLSAAFLSASGGEPDSALHDPPGAFPYELAFGMAEFRRYDQSTVSPDGSLLAYVVVAPPEKLLQNERFLPNGTPSNAVGARIYLTETAAGKDAAGQIICAGRGNQWSPSWSPDGRRLAFYSDAEGPPQLWEYSHRLRTCRKVSPAAIRTSVFAGNEARWAPDGNTLYVPLDPDPPVTAARGHSETAAVEAASVPNQPTVFFSGSENEGGPVEGANTSGSNTAILMRYYNSSLAAIDSESGQVRVVADAISKPRPGKLKISPSGRWMTYSSVLYREKEISIDYVMDLAVVPTGGGVPQVVAKGLPSSEHSVNYASLDYRWHPHEDRLVYLKDNGLWVVDFDQHGAASPRRLAAELGDLAPAVLYFTRDGRSLVVGTEPTGLRRDRVPQRLALVPLDGARPSSFALPDAARWKFLDLIRANTDVVWQPDSRYVSVVMRERSSGEQAVTRFDTATGKSKTLASGLYRIGQFRAGGDHRSLVAIYEDVATPPNLYRFQPGFSGKQRLSTIEPRLGGGRYGTVKVFETRAPLFDGTLANVRTTLLLPPGAKQGDRLPGIVMIYSGSDLSTRASYFGGGMGNTVPNLVFTSRGFAVIMADIVLSPEGNADQPIQRMVDVLLPQVYHAANAGYVDIDRLAVSGQSYGGYSTAAIVSQTNLFRAGIPVNGTFDVASFYGGMAEEGNSHWINWAEKGQGRMGNSPWANPQRYIDNSPYYRVDRIRTPLLIVVGKEDSTVPYWESQKLFVGLRRLERPAQLAIYPGEGHVISEWSRASAVDVSKRMVSFLQKHLAASALSP